MTLEQISTSGQRQRLLALLRKTYHHDWTELVRDFDPAPGVESWEDLERHGVLFLRPGGKGLRTERQFLALLAERYYSLMREIIRKYDPRALILGDRYQSFFYPEVARAAAPYVDAVSSNLNAAWNHGSFPRFYLETLHALCGKPVMVGEFYLAAGENRTGNRNTAGVFPVVATQQKRAAGARNTLLALLKIPYVMGADWFQYYDEPTHGRYDGENFNFGLVDIHDRPYEELVKTMAGLNLLKLKSEKTKPRLDVSGGIPRAPENPVRDFKPLLALKEWDRERGFVVPASEFPMADLYLCWNKEAVYLGLYAHDVCEDIFYRDKVVRASDRAEWTVSLGGREEPIRARVGAGLPCVVSEPALRLTNHSGINGNFRNIACLELPARMFGRDRFRPGDEIEFASQFSTQGGGYLTAWKGRFKMGR